MCMGVGVGVGVGGVCKGANDEAWVPCVCVCMIGCESKMMPIMC